MIWKIAWKNIWRNRTRSLVVIMAVMLGVWAILFLNGLTVGIVRTFVQDAITKDLSHIQIHVPRYLDERDVLDTLPQLGVILEELNQNPLINKFNDRIIISGMLTTPKGTRGVMIKAVDAAAENELTGISSDLIEGRYLNDENRLPIYIGNDLAKKLKLKLNQKVVLSFQWTDGEINSQAFRITGFYQTSNRRYDELNVFVRRQDLVGDSTRFAHEIALLCHDEDSIPTVLATVKNKYSLLSVRDYKEISPDVELYETQIGLSNLIVMVIVLLALVFGIINTMLMVVLERVKELGMLMAIGMNKIRIYLMILLETMLLSLLGVPIGMLLGHFTIQYFGGKGINLSAYSQAMREFGMSSVMYPQLRWQDYVTLAFGVLITAIVGAVYPAWKATRLNPVEAIHTI